MTAAAANGGSNSNKNTANKKEETGIKSANNIKNDCAYRQSERERERGIGHRVQPPFLSFSPLPSASPPCFLDSFTINSDTSTFCHPVARAGSLLYALPLFIRATLIADGLVPRATTTMRRGSTNGASHSIVSKAHETSIALLANVDAPVTPKRACDHPRPLTDGRAAADSRTARASTLFSPFLSLSLPLHVSLSLSLSLPPLHPFYHRQPRAQEQPRAGLNLGGGANITAADLSLSPHSHGSVAFAKKRRKHHDLTII